MSDSIAQAKPAKRPATWRLTRPTIDVASALALTAAILGAAIMMVPFVWALLSSFKPEVEYTLVPPTWLPRQWTLEAYRVAWNEGRIWIGIKNSLIVSSISTSLMVLGAALGGYAFARLRFPFKRSLFLIILATMMIPWPVTLLPLYLIFLRFPLAGGNDIWGLGGTGLVNTYEALILPHLAYPFGLYLMREFYKTLPAELEDAARVDGAGELRVLFEIMVPLCKPALAALAILAFQGNWNAFIWPLVITTSPSMNTVQLSLQQLQYLKGFDVIRWDVVTAGGMIALVPLAITFLTGQRYFIRGIAMTGFK
jgi:multiple sugar transport system permease protein